MEILYKAILVLIPVLISVLRLTSSGKSIFNYKRKRRENLAMVLREIDSLKLDSEYKNSIEEEYKRILLEEIKGFGITPHNNKIIIESGILDHYTNSHIKIAYPFFDYSNNELSIKINSFEKFKAVTFSIMAILYILLGVLFIVYSNYEHNSKFLTFYGFATISILFGFYTIHLFVTPLAVARLIKKDLDRKNGL